MVSRAMSQIVLIGIICLGTIGMFNAMSSIGNAGKHSPTAQNLVITSSSIAYIVGFLVAGGLHNMLGPRPCVAFGGLTFFLYAGAMLLSKDDEYSIYPPLAGVLLGLGAGCIWVTQGAMMMSYPTENNKGKYISVFWAIFNLGAVLGSIISLAMNTNTAADPDDVTSATYIVYMIIMGLATLLVIFLVRPSSIIRDNGEPVTVEKFAGVKAEFSAILSVFCDWRMLLLIPAFFFSNFSYTYQFNDFNGFNFNIRTRSLNSISFWVAQIVGALAIGYLLDRLPMRRPRRALLGLIVIAILFMGTWMGALYMQLTHKWQRKVPNGSDLIDYQHGNGYPGPLIIYTMFGFCDAAFAVYCYWLIGALSNKHDELSRYAGFFKAIQSLGGAVAAPLDLAETPLLYYLIINWILCAFSMAAMFLVCRTITDTTVEEEYDEEYEDYLDDTGSYYTNTTTGDRSQPRPSMTHSNSFDENLSTICATSEGSKTACGSRTSQKAGGWRAGSGVNDFDEKDLEDNCSSPRSSGTVASNQSKRRSSSVRSAASMADCTTCPSPTFQPPHDQNRSISRRSRAPPMSEIRDDSRHFSQHLTVPGQVSSVNPIVSISSGNNESGSRSGIENSDFSQLASAAPIFTFSSSLPSSNPQQQQFQHDPYLYSSWATSPPPQVNGFLMSQIPVESSISNSPVNMYLNTPLPTVPAASAAPRSSFGDVGHSISTRYNEEQDMDSIDTCSLSSMSSGHDSIPEMSEMGPGSHQRPRPPAPVMKQEASKIPPLEIRNVRLRFFLGPNNLDILRCTEEVMEKYPVILHQIDYRFDIYGHPKDIADVFREYLFITNKFRLFSPQQEEEDQKTMSQNLAKGSNSNPTSSTFRQRDPQENDILQFESNPSENNEKTYASFDVDLEKLITEDTSILSNPTETDKKLDVLPFHPTEGVDTSRRNESRIKDEAHKLKSDFQLAKERREHSPSSDDDTDSTEPWSLILVLSMDERIAHYLLHRSGGFRSYLAEQQDIESCAKTVRLDELKALADSAGLSVGVSKHQLPGSDEIPVWLKVWDMNALKDIIVGVTTALAEEVLYLKEACWIGKEELARRKEWDLRLGQYKGSRKDEYSDDVWMSFKDAENDLEAKVEENGDKDYTDDDSDLDMKNEKVRAKDKGKQYAEEGDWGFKPPGYDRGFQKSRNGFYGAQGADHMDSWMEKDLDFNKQPYDESGNYQHRIMEERSQKIPQSSSSRALADFTRTSSQSIASFFSDDEEPSTSSRAPEVHPERGSSSHNPPPVFPERGGNTYYPQQSSRSSSMSSRGGQGSSTWGRTNVDVDEVSMVQEWASPQKLAEVQKWHETGTMRAADTTWGGRARPAERARQLQSRESGNSWI
ncbi:hypothetical protein BGZ46_000636 [Entomortierella lignicola]|nr:hypothetical protein BGZ46_000636 [Entomortierella lignicola]